MKTCPRCKETKPYNEFYKAKERKDGYRSTCKACCFLQHRDWYRKSSTKRRQQTKDEIRASNLKKKYGITIEEYEELVQAQNSTCAICGTDDPGRRLANWAIDHCHETGKVRGLLCHQCNMGLGSFKDNGYILVNAIKYLLKSR